ncbi:MAG: sodium-dependent transporter, partial [Woeseiaceae bacterium]|nr:sodium-dependent transporter [Woeseiaceae bacterium]
MTTTGGLQWSSRMTFIMASVGCAVGLGNIWLFPYTAGSSGGGAFVLIYLAAVVTLALPVLIVELMVGRRGAAGPPQAIANVARESGRSEKWRWMGVVLGVVGALTALGFYGVVGGWTLAYSFKLAFGRLEGLDVPAATREFDIMNGDPWALLPWVVVFMIATIGISARGLHAGIEKAVKFMMPALFLMLVAMVVYAAVVGDFARALGFLFRPDFSKVDSNVVLAAFGQAFFSVSVGITNMMAYGSYMERSTKLPQSAGVIVTADTAVALLAGLAIFPLVFMIGLQPAGGPGLVFMTLPFAFGQIPGGLVFGTVFFVLLFFAALTSSIGMLEPPVAWLRDATKLDRRQAAALAGSVALTLCLLGALSFNVLAGVHPLGMFEQFADKGFFDLFVYVVTQLIMPVGGILVCVFAGWVVKREFCADELFDGRETLAFRAWHVIVRYVAPVLLAFVLIDVA